MADHKRFVQAGMERLELEVAEKTEREKSEQAEREHLKHEEAAETESEKTEQAERERLERQKAEQAHLERSVQAGREPMTGPEEVRKKAEGGSGDVRRKIEELGAERIQMQRNADTYAKGEFHISQEIEDVERRMKELQQRRDQLEHEKNMQRMMWESRVLKVKKIEEELQRMRDEARRVVDEKLREIDAVNLQLGDPRARGWVSPTVSPVSGRTTPLVSL